MGPVAAERRTYRAARLFDGHECVDQPVRVTIAGDRIVGVDPAPEPDRRDLDFGDATIMPGMIDAHVHLTWSGGARPEEEVERSHPSNVAVRTAVHAQQHLANGVTTVRDVGSASGHAIAIGRAIDAGVIAGPSIVAAGHALAMTGGHVWRHIAREADGRDGLRRAVRLEVRDGAQCIKLMASGGILGDAGEQPGAVELLTDELQSAVAEAHKLNRTVAAHAHSRTAISNAVHAGVDSVEHGSMLDAATAVLMRQRGTVLVPTVSAVEALVDTGVRLGVSEHVAARAAGARQHWRAAVKTAVEADVTIAAGTDAGVPGQPHGSVVDEVSALVEMGMRRDRALRACTSVAAQLLGRDDIGSVAVGHTADLAVVDGDPAADVRALRDVRYVIRRGRLLRLRDPDDSAWQPLLLTSSALRGVPPR